MLADILRQEEPGITRRQPFSTVVSVTAIQTEVVARGLIGQQRPSRCQGAFRFQEFGGFDVDRAELLLRMLLAEVALEKRKQLGARKQRFRRSRARPEDPYRHRYRLLYCR